MHKLIALRKNKAAFVHCGKIVDARKASAKLEDVTCKDCLKR